MLRTRLARAHENVFWLDDRGDKGPCKRVGAKLMSRASSMEWRGTTPSTQEASFLGDSQCSVRSTYSATATRRGTIDSRDAMASRSCRCTHAHAYRAEVIETRLYYNYMACLALAINCTRIRECLLAGRPKRLGPL